MPIVACLERGCENEGVKNPVVLVHGIYDTGRVFRRLREALEAAGWEVHCLDLTPNDGRNGLEELALQVAAFVETLERTVDLVGLSMGGLVCRYYLQRLGGMARVERFVTLSSPHRGTLVAYGRGGVGIRQMRPGSAFLRDLAGDAAVLSGVRFTSIWTPFDLMILPAGSSVLGVGKSVRVGVAAHYLVVKSARVIK